MRGAREVTGGGEGCCQQVQSGTPLRLEPCRVGRDEPDLRPAGGSEARIRMQTAFGKPHGAQWKGSGQGHDNMIRLDKCHRIGFPIPLTESGVIR